jgi:hypothetical protein
MVRSPAFVTVDPGRRLFALLSPHRPAVAITSPLSHYLPYPPVLPCYFWTTELLALGRLQQQTPVARFITAHPSAQTRRASSTRWPRPSIDTQSLRPYIQSLQTWHPRKPAAASARRKLASRPFRSLRPRSPPSRPLLRSQTTHR